MIDTAGLVGLRISLERTIDVCCGACGLTTVVIGIGGRDRPISPQSPWQNGYAERLIGTRRECLDQMVIFGETHLRRILSAYTAYYNQARTHLALQKDAPLHRAVQQSGAIVAIPILAGLHHQYVRI
jgi:Integrase core domain